MRRITFNPFGFIVRPHRIGLWLLLGFLALYAVICVFLFVQWVNPSLLHHSNQRIAADSATYMYMAEVLHSGRPNPWVYASLAPFPNTLWVPVFLSFVLRNTAWIVLLNLSLWLLSIDLFRRSCTINIGLFVGLLLLNPTTTVSILSVNKEIIDLFVVSAFCFGLKRRNRWLLFVALTIAFLNRYEVCVALTAVLLVSNKLNPLRNHRKVVLISLSLLLTFALPMFAANSFARRFTEAEQGGLVRLLDIAEMHYLFILAIVPKIAENMLGELINISSWHTYSLRDLANSYILFFNDLANAFVIMLLVVERAFRLRNDWIYFAAISGIFMASSFVNQPRYFYFCFVFLCLQAAQSARFRVVLSTQESRNEICISPATLAPRSE